MEKMTIIKNVEANIPESILSGYIMANGKDMLVSEFLETVVIHSIKENYDPNKVSEFFIKNFLTKIHYKEVINVDKRRYVEDFINNTFGYQSQIQTGPEIYLNVTEYLLNEIAPKLDDDLMIPVGPYKKNIEEVYRTLINNTYSAPTLADKTELCLFECEAIDDEVLASMMDMGNGKTISVKDYIVKELPQLMTSATGIQVDGEEISIDLFIKKIVDHQLTIINEQKEEKFNRTGENPSLVGEIKVAMENSKLEITSEIPIIPTDEELKAMEMSAFASTMSTSKYYQKQMDYLIDMIARCDSLHNLELLSLLYNNLISEFNPSEHSETIKNIVSYVGDLLKQRQIDFIKIDTNKEEIVASLDTELNTIAEYISQAKSIEECVFINGKMVELEERMQNLGITDNNTFNKLNSLKDAFNGKTISLGEANKYRALDNQVLKSDENNLKN